MAHIDSGYNRATTNTDYSSELPLLLSGEGSWLSIDYGSLDQEKDDECQPEAQA